MAETTQISWAEATWNPWYGCRKVSAGCKFCYAERDMTKWGKDFGAVTRAKTTFDAPLRWKEPKRVFACSWSDWFIAEADPWRAAAWEVVRRTPQHTYMILTKRPERIAHSLPAGWGDGWANVWLGVSAENQDALDARFPVLASVPAAVRFVSAEPLLGPLDIEPHIGGIDLDKGFPRHIPGIDWVICGGESGPKRRPMDMAWARRLCDQCEIWSIPFFFKQDSDLRPGQRPWIVAEDGSRWAWYQFPDALTPPERIEP